MNEFTVRMNDIFENVNSIIVNGNICYEVEAIFSKIDFDRGRLKNLLLRHLPGIPFNAQEEFLYFKNEDSARLVIEASFLSRHSVIDELVTNMLEKARIIKVNSDLSGDLVINLADGELSNDLSLIDNIIYARIKDCSLEKIALALIKNTKNL